jgi:hypothetical protein
MGHVTSGDRATGACAICAWPPELAAALVVNELSAMGMAMGTAGREPPALLVPAAAAVSAVDESYSDPGSEYGYLRVDDPMSDEEEMFEWGQSLGMDPAGAVVMTAAGGSAAGAPEQLQQELVADIDSLYKIYASGGGSEDSDDSASLQFDLFGSDSFDGCEAQQDERPQGEQEQGTPAAGSASKEAAAAPQVQQVLQQVQQVQQQVRATALEHASIVQLAAPGLAIHSHTAGLWRLLAELPCLRHLHLAAVDVTLDGAVAPKLTSLGAGGLRRRRIPAAARAWAAAAAVPCARAVAAAAGARRPAEPEGGGGGWQGGAAAGGYGGGAGGSWGQRCGGVG